MVRRRGFNNVTNNGLYKMEGNTTSNVVRVTSMYAVTYIGKGTY